MRNRSDIYCVGIVCTAAREAIANVLKTHTNCLPQEFCVPLSAFLRVKLHKKRSCLHTHKMSLFGCVWQCDDSAKISNGTEQNGPCNANRTEWTVQRKQNRMDRATQTEQNGPCNANRTEWIVQRKQNRMDRATQTEQNGPCNANRTEWTVQRKQNRMDRATQTEQNGPCNANRTEWTVQRKRN